MSSAPLLPWMVKKSDPSTTAPPAQKKQKLTPEVIDLTQSPDLPPVKAPPAQAPSIDEIQTFGLLNSLLLIFPEAIDLVTSGPMIFGGVERYTHTIPASATAPASNYYILRVVVMDNGEKKLVGQLDTVASNAILTCPERGIHIQCILRPGM
jgi:hypothetical protein